MRDLGLGVKAMSLLDQVLVLVLSFPVVSLLMYALSTPPQLDHRHVLATRSDTERFAASAGMTVRACLQPKKWDRTLTAMTRSHSLAGMVTGADLRQAVLGHRLAGPWGWLASSPDLRPWCGRRASSDHGSTTLGGG